MIKDMDTQIEDILDRILQSYPQTVFTKNIEFIRKTNANYFCSLIHSIGF